MTEKELNLIHEYWYKTEFGRRMIESNAITNDDLLFLIPNNVKRRHGLPASRNCNKHKSIMKKCRKRLILSFRLHERTNETAQNILLQPHCRAFYKQFENYKDINFGERRANNILKEGTVVWVRPLYAGGKVRITGKRGSYGIISGWSERNECYYVNIDGDIFPVGVIPEDLDVL